MDECSQTERDNSVIGTTPEPDSESELERRYPKRNRKPRTDLHSIYINSMSKPTKQKRQKHDDDDAFHKMDSLYSWYKWSDCKLAQRYDRERDFYPQPGPSTLNYYENDLLIGYYRPVRKSKFAKKSTARQNDILKKRASNTHTEVRAKVPKMRKNDYFLRNSPLHPTAHNNDSDWGNDIRIQSFYEQTYAKTRNSPENCISPVSNSSDCSEPVDKNATLSTPLITKFLENFKKSPNEKKCRQDAAADIYRIRPIEDAPSHCDIKQLLDSHQLPKFEHLVPYYSDPSDVLANNSRKDVGNTVLQLTGRAANDCEEFISNFDVVGMNQWQRSIAQYAERGLRSVRDARVLENPNVVRTLLTGRKEKMVRIMSMDLSPDHSQVNQWLQMRTEQSKKKRASEQHNEISDGKSNGVQQQRLVNGLLANKELTVLRITKNGKEKLIKSKSQNNSQVHIVNDSDDDVICLDDETNELPMKNAELVGFPQ